MFTSFYFGPAPDRLFGAYHEASAGAARRHLGVLLVPALGHEYVQCHFAYKTLALRLAELGFPVLRMEYRGCGNAGGSWDALELQDWMIDIERAGEELARRSGAPGLCVAGIRLGAALAALAAGSSPAVDAALLWDPVLDGSRYLAEMQARHADFLASLPRGGAVEPESGGEGVEILGFRLGPQMVSDIASLEPAALARSLTAKQVLFLDGQASPASPAERDAIRSRCGRFAYAHAPAAEPWLEQPHHVFLPGRAIGEIASWMESVG